MTTTAQRNEAAYLLGCRDFEERKPRIAPTYFVPEERIAYDRGYTHAQRDLLRSWAGKNGGAL